MYKVVDSEGSLVANVESPVYISLSKSGSYSLCDESRATGVAIDGVPYHIIGREAMNGNEVEVVVEKIDGGSVAFQNTQGINDLTNQVISMQELMVEQVLNNDLSGLEGIEDLDI